MVKALFVRTPHRPDLATKCPQLYTRGVKIALGQINPTVGDFSGNASKIIDFSRRAQAAGAGLILFPELSVCGYPPRDLVERPSFVTRNRETVDRIAAETQGIAVICGLVTPAHSDTGKSAMNSAALLMDGKVAFIQSKMLLPTYDVFDEMRNFAPAKRQELFSFCGNRMALTICEDAWNDKRFWRQAAVYRGSRGLFDSGWRKLRAEYFRLAVLDRQTRIPPRHAGQHCPPAQGSGRAGQSGRRKRQSGVRRLQRGAES